MFAPSQRIELALALQDIEDAIRIINAMQAHENGPVYPYALTGAIALVVEESTRLLKSDPATAPLANKHLQKARARLKMFDDTEGYAKGLTEVLSTARRKSNEWFCSHHRGPLGPLKRALQPDLGIYWIDQHLLATTHTALPALGFSHAELEAMPSHALQGLKGELFTYGLEAGRALRAIAAELKASGICSASVAAGEPAEVPITHNDFKSERFYRATTLALRIPSEQHTEAVVFATAQINSATHLLPQILPSSSNLLFRFRVLTAYHAVRTLSQSLEDGRLGGSHWWLPSPPTIPTEARNLCGHYGLRSAARFARDSLDPLGAAIEGICEIPRRQMDADVSRWLEGSSAALLRGISKQSMKPYRALFGEHT